MVAELRDSVAGEIPIQCTFCEGRCYRLAGSRWYFAKEVEKAAKGARNTKSKRRVIKPPFVYCPKCRRPRDKKGRPLPPDPDYSAAPSS